jgi:hypothetical protein
MFPLYLLIIVFPKFDPLTAKGMALYRKMSKKFQNLFSLFWVLAESSLAYTETKRNRL